MNRISQYAGFVLLVGMTGAGTAWAEPPFSPGALDSRSSWQQQRCEHNPASVWRCPASREDWTLGYQVSPYWGVEAYYVDLGWAAKGGAAGTDRSPFGAVAAVGVAATGTLPVTSQLSAYGKLGSFAWALPGRNGLGGRVGRLEEGRSDFSLGVGARFRLSRQLSLRLEWERYGDLGRTGEQKTLELFSAKARFNF